jgi:uncharacterized protein (DUF983 family)
MADSSAAGISIVVGGITIANEVLFAPLASGKPTWQMVNVWRVVPATLGLALALSGLEKVAPKFAVGLAWLSLATVLIVPFGKAPTPLDNALKVMGYK